MDDDKLIDLIARCAIRDENALKQLYTQASGYLNYTAYRILHCEEASNEVLQESFFQIWQKAETYRPHLSKPMTWMNSIVRYRSIDKLNAEKRIKANVTEVDDIQFLYDSVAGSESPQVDAENCSLSKHIGYCMSSLSNNIRTSIELAYFHGDSREEIAVKLRSNPNTVKSWLHRGCARLKACLEGDFKVSL